VDVGGTNTAAGVVDSQGRVLSRRRILTQPARGGEAVLDNVLALAEDLGQESRRRGWSVSALGVGVCELVSPSGDVLSDQTVAWRRLPIRERLNQVAPAVLEADSRAAAFCEARCGVGQPFRSFLYVTIGTGIGSSLVLEGVPFAGARGCTGTLASAPTTLWCPHCAQLSSIVLEEVASGPGLVARYNHQGGAKLSRAEEVLAAAHAGDACAIGVIDNAASMLGATIALLVSVLDPEALIIGGGLGAAPGLYWAHLATHIRTHIWSDIHRNLPLLQASRGGEAGFIGAALLALEHQKKDSHESE
jgi:glucokinase